MHWLGEILITDLQDSNKKKIVIANVLVTCVSLHVSNVWDIKWVLKAFTVDHLGM